MVINSNGSGLGMLRLSESQVSTGGGSYQIGMQAQDIVDIASRTLAITTCSPG